jgi:Ca2+-binding RTX toxin-like protein
MILQNSVSDPIYLNGMPSMIDPDSILRGTPKDDVLKGDRPSNVILGYEGNDLLIGGRGMDTLIGADGNDLLKGRGGNDILQGGRGNDTLLGGDGNDVLYGDRGRDVLRGGAGDDILFGGPGNDVLIGGPGADAFVLEFNQSGVDRIRDFESGVDKLGLFALDGNPYRTPEPGELEAFIADLTLKQRGNHTVIQFEDRAIAILKNIDATTITASDFAPIVIAV